MMKRGSSALFALVLAASVPFAPGLARAQSPEDRESARRLFEDGRARRDSGDAAGALEAFRAADALMNVPTTKLAVARAYLALGKLVEARDVALGVARLPVASAEPAPFTDARAAAAQLATEIAGRIPSVAIAIQGDAPDSLSVDGATVPREAWSVPRRVNAGKHTVVARLGARAVTQDFAVAEGESASVALDMRALPPEASPRPHPDVPAATRPLGALFWISAGVGATGLAVGGVAGVVSIASKGTADSLCRDNKCPPPAYASLDAANTWANVSTIAFVAAGAGAALAIAGFVLRPSASPTSATLIVRPGGADLVGSF
jgi:hypothetical protein